MFESAGGDAGLWLSRLFGGGGGTAIAANTVPTTDYGAALGAMNPGMAGMGAVPNEAFNASQPFTSGNTALGNVSNKQVSDALGQLGKGAGGGAAAGKGAGPVMPGAGHAAAVGTPGRGALSNLDALVQMLNKQRQGLMPGGATSGQPQGAQPTMGLLGF